MLVGHDWTLAASMARCHADRGCSRNRYKNLDYLVDADQLRVALKLAVAMACGRRRRQHFCGHASERWRLADVAPRSKMCCDSACECGDCGATSCSLELAHSCPLRSGERTIAQCAAGSAVG